MRFHCYAYLFLSLLLTGCATRNEELLVQLELANNWEFRSTSESNWHKASVPGDIISNASNVKGYGSRWLLNHNQLNTLLNTSWEYRNVFEVSESVLYKDSIDISFPDIRWPASVYINDSLLSRRMVNETGYAISCKRFLKEGKNELRIIFDSFNLPENKDTSYLDPKVDVVSQLIKGLDNLSFKNTPDIPGLIEAPYLTAWSVARIEDVYFYPLTISEKSAQYNAEINILASKETEMNLEISVDERTLIKLYELKLKPGINKQIVSFTIANPKLWWTNGLGQHYLYKTTFRLFSSKQLAHEVTYPLGARKLEIVYEPDSIKEPMKFFLNGNSLFLKGGIVDIPCNLNPSEVETVYPQIIENIKSANINIIRLLRADFYRSDLFYKLCSENGILIWQDLPVSIDPSVQHSRKISYAVEQSLKCLRNMPSCAVYMGRVVGACDNDKNKLSFKVGSFVKKDLPLMIKKFDHRTFYWDLQVNNELYSKEVAKQNIDACLVNSLGLRKSGGAALGSYISSSSFVDFASSLGISSGEVHSKMSSSGYLDTVLDVNTAFALHIQQTNKLYPAPVNMESALYISQLYQAGQIKQSIEDYRLKGKDCIGFANLEIYDPIPVSFGNSIDFWGRTKPAYYYLKNSYAANILVAQTEGLFVNVYAINDELKDVDAILLCKTIDFYGNTYFVKQVPVTVKANSNALLLRLSKKELLNSLSPNKVALLLQLNQPGRTNAQNIYYFAEPKLLELPKTSIKVDINQTNQGFNVILKSSVLVKNLFLETNRPDTRFSDNNIDLLPGKRYKIVVSYRGSRDELTKNLVIKSLNNLLTGL